MVKGILLGVAMLALLLMVFYLSGESASVLDSMARGGYLPRAAAWACLILSVYGMARRRFSPLLMLLFYAGAFFFTYLGQFFLKGLY